MLLSLNFQQDLRLFVDHMELGLLSITPLCLMLTVALCLVIDGQSSLMWSSYRYARIERKVMRDMTTIILIAINLIIIECDDAGITAVFLWMVVMMSTCFFPPFVLTVLLMAGGLSYEPISHHILSSGRDASVVIFALRHAALASFLGYQPALDAALIMQLARRNFVFVTVYELVPTADGVWCNFGSEFILGFLILRFSMWAIETKLEEIPWLTIVATIVFPIMNFLVQHITRVGIQVGTLVFKEGRANVLAGQMGVRSAVSIYGTMIFSIWATLMLLLIVTF